MISTNGKVHTSARPAEGEAHVHRVSTQPSWPRTLWTAWNAYSHRAAGYQGELLLSVVYMLVLGPSGLVARLLGQKLMDLSTSRRASYWIARRPAEKSLTALQRQF
jgi:hypothetical protein